STIPLIENVVDNVSCDSASNGMVTNPVLNLRPLPSKKPPRVCPSRISAPIVPVGREVPEITLKVAPARQGYVQLDRTDPAGASPAPPTARKLVPWRSNPDET